MEFNFTTREEYLKQVSIWKQEYAQLSQNIRAWKYKFRKAQSIEDKGGTPELASWRARSNLESLQKLARKMLDDRADSKVEAGKQWAAARETV